MIAKLVLLLALPLIVKAGVCVDEEKNCVNVGPDCKNSDYTGTQAKSMSGEECVRWDAQPSDAYGQAVLDSENYCRNPDHEETGPWCFLKKDLEPCFKPCETTAGEAEGEPEPEVEGEVESSGYTAAASLLAVLAALSSYLLCN